MTLTIPSLFTIFIGIISPHITNAFPWVTFFIFVILQGFCYAYAAVEKISAMMYTSWYAFPLFLTTQITQYLIRRDESTIKTIRDRCETDDSLQFLMFSICIVFFTFCYIKHWKKITIPNQNLENVQGLKNILMENHPSIRKVLWYIFVVLFYATICFKYQTIPYTLSFYQGAGVYHVSNITQHVQGIHELCIIERIGRNSTRSCEMEKFLNISQPSCYNQHIYTSIIVCSTLVFTQGVLVFFLCAPYLYELWNSIDTLPQRLWACCTGLTPIVGAIFYYNDAFYTIPCNNAFSEFLIVIYCFLLFVPVLAVGFFCYMHEAAPVTESYTNDNMTSVIEIFFTLFMLVSTVSTMSSIQVIYHEFLKDFFEMFYMAGYTCMSKFQRMTAILHISNGFEWQNPPLILDLDKFNRRDCEDDCVRTIFNEYFSSGNALTCVSFLMAFVLLLWICNRTNIMSFHLALFQNALLRVKNGGFFAPSEEVNDLSDDEDDSDYDPDNDD